MIFYLHYILMTSGLSGTTVLLAVFFQEYSDASQGEIGTLLMSFHFVSLLLKPLFCSMADRSQAYKLYLIVFLAVELAGYSVFAIIPLFPSFYLNHPRWSWWVMVVGSHVGYAGLGVAWSLGDCLAMNISQKTGTPFGRMRLTGTVSWGLYGFIIGQINETPALPKYTPAFLILLGSLLLEIILLICWNNDDFVMVDTLASAAQRETPNAPGASTHHDHHPMVDDLMKSTPSSLGGTLRLDPNTANALRDVFARPEDVDNKLRNLEEQTETKIRSTPNNNNDNNKNINKNPQLALLKMIFVEDGRFTKYIVLFSVFGLFLAPTDFVFLSMEEICQKKGFNFSQLAGAVLISQAASETAAFLFCPMTSKYVTRSIFMALAFLLMALRFIFYAGWYYDDDVSPYWSLLGEWADGIGYGIFCTIKADVALMFADQARLFIKDLRHKGYLNQVTPDTPKQQVDKEERAIKMSLRATMQAIFDGLMIGLGSGAGALLCGVLIELYDYIRSWQFFYILAFVSLFLHQLMEITRSRWSDTYRAKKGTKAYEIMLLNGDVKGMGNSRKTNSSETGRPSGCTCGCGCECKANNSGNKCRDQLDKPTLDSHQTSCH